MMAVEVKTTAGRFEPGIPKALFTLPALDPRNSYAVTDDGQKFLAVAQQGDTDSASDPITVVLNWLPGLRR